uniref:Uncharacterized protein n=1 Tax=Trypanosoma congolense (strain IL3000) TaxID=1068625 RepID=G0V3F7_TRYCI|nr:hypothetical protein, unlikely [Trypanosoma congolense IL3000]
MNVHSVLVSATGLKEAMLPAGLLDFNCGTKTPCFHFSGTWLQFRLSFNNRSTHFLSILPMCWSSSECIPSFPRAVPLEGSRSAASSYASVIGLNVPCLVRCSGFAYMALLVPSLTALCTFSPVPVLLTFCSWVTVNNWRW